jgi:hypothetical protein
MIKRNKSAIILLMPLVAFVWLVGWVFSFLGSENPKYGIEKTRQSNSSSFLVASKKSSMPSFNRAALRANNLRGKSSVIRIQD